MIADVDRRKDGTNILVAFGTSQNTSMLFSGEFLVSMDMGTAFKASGLSMNTKFNLKKMEWLPWNDDWFVAPPQAIRTASPILGFAHPSLYRSINAALAGIKLDK
jgi:hypothetical protein